MRDEHRRELHLQQGDLRPLHVQLQSRTIRQAGADAETGAVRGPGPYVVALFPVAMAAGSVRQPSRFSEDAGDSVPPARWTRRLRALEARPEIFFLLRAADAGVDARADLLHEFQVRLIAVGGPRRHRPARGTRPRLLLLVELLGVECVGGAGSRVRLGDGGGIARSGAGQAR